MTIDLEEAHERICKLEETVSTLEGRMVSKQLDDGLNTSVTTMTLKPGSDESPTAGTLHWTHVEPAIVYRIDVVCTDDSIRHRIKVYSLRSGTTQYLDDPEHGKKDRFLGPFPIYPWSGVVASVASRAPIESQVAMVIRWKPVDCPPPAEPILTVGDTNVRRGD